MADLTTQAVRRWVMTGSVAAITAVGTWYGAGLKTQREYKEEIKTRRQATPTERIEQLEVTRVDLVRKRTALEKKLAELHARQPKVQNASGLVK